MTIPPYDNSSNEIEIYIKILEGGYRTITLHINPHITIHNLKECIHSNCKIPTKLQNLIHKNVYLEDNLSLSDYNIKDKGIIHLILLSYI